MSELLTRHGELIALSILYCFLCCMMAYLGWILCKDLREYLNRWHTNRSKPFNCIGELERMITRVLRSEKHHEGKVFLINLLFPDMPVEVTYRSLNVSLPNRGKHLTWSESVCRILGAQRATSSICTDSTWIIHVYEATALVPQFSLEDGTVFTLIRVASDKVVLNIEDGFLLRHPLRESISKESSSE